MHAEAVIARLNCHLLNWKSIQALYKQRLIGYRYEHTMKLEFDSDDDLLGRLLYTLANGKIRPEFRISYTVKDQEAVKNTLLGKAVTDAKEKASVLTVAAGVRLMDIQTIDYSGGEIDFEMRPMNRGLLYEADMAGADSPKYSLDIEPYDIEVSDTVTVVWEIA